MKHTNTFFVPRGHLTLLVWFSLTHTAFFWCCRLCPCLCGLRTPAFYTLQSLFFRSFQGRIISSTGRENKGLGALVQELGCCWGCCIIYPNRLNFGLFHCTGRWWWRLTVTWPPSLTRTVQLALAPIVILNVYLFIFCFEFLDSCLRGLLTNMINIILLRFLSRTLCYNDVITSSTSAHNVTADQCILKIKMCFWVKVTQHSLVWMFACFQIFTHPLHCRVTLHYSHPRQTCPCPGLTFGYFFGLTGCNGEHGNLFTPQLQNTNYQWTNTVDNKTNMTAQKSERIWLKRANRRCRYAFRSDERWLQVSGRVDKMTG